MPLQKQNIPINFAQGVDTKTDPKQIKIGRFLELVNSVFTEGGDLTKRYGFPALPPVPSSSAIPTLLTTFNGNLTAIGSELQAYSQSLEEWVTKGPIQPATLSVQTLVRSSVNQTQADTAISNGLICTVFTNVVQTSPVIQAVSYEYVVADAVTGQNLLPPTGIPGATLAARVFALGDYFVIVSSGAFGESLQYVTINTQTLVVSGATELSEDFQPLPSMSFDGTVSNGVLYLAWAAFGGGSTNVSYLTSALVQSPTVKFLGVGGVTYSVSVDVTQSPNVVYISCADQASVAIHVMAVDTTLATVLAPQTVFISPSIVPSNVTSIANAGSVEIFYEVNNTYAYDTTIPTHYIEKVNVTQAGTVGAQSIVVRSVGLGSKAFVVNQPGVGNTTYFVCAFQSPFQPTYFVSDSSGNLIAKLAYSNGGGYYATGLPSAQVTGQTVNFPYLIKDSVVPVNKNVNPTAPGGIFSQTGINLCTLTIGETSTLTSEIASNLHFSGGFLWMYDGYLPVEHNFHVWPESAEVLWSETGGQMAAKPDGSTNTNAYYYGFVYEWNDNQGNLFRSAPSVPVAVTTTGSGTTGSTTLLIPTLRLTYKTANPLRVVPYRWSVAQQTFYQLPPAVIPLNQTTADFVTIQDTYADDNILGNEILYTTGGIVENIAAPAFTAVTLFKARLFGIDAEDENLLWFSKQVIEATPVDMSDLFTIYVPPSQAGQGNTGVMRSLGAMDDKIIIFKKNAAYYMTGDGPADTGADDDYSEPIFITSTVGCSNQRSIVNIPQGIMFRSDQGIYLLGRDLSINYIGAPVEKFNSATVVSALSIPDTTQVRFNLDNGIVLMYDYYYDQWGWFDKLSAVSATLYNSRHTFIDSLGRVFQETPGIYTDGDAPVLVNFTTGWVNPASLQGYQRAYFFYFLANFNSPHKVGISIAYDYALSPSQSLLITPSNYAPPWGGDTSWGTSSPWGGPGNIEQWKVNLNQQRCQAFQISMQEQFDPSWGTAPGAGFTMSGLNLVVGIKKGYMPIQAANTAG